MIKGASPAGGVSGRHEPLSAPSTVISVEVRLFNAVGKYGNGRTRFSIELPPSATVGDALARVPVPEDEIFLLLHNGRNVMAGFGPSSGIERGHVLADGDVLAFSGPVPFSRGYGSPVI